jgi:hypothetical protein
MQTIRIELPAYHEKQKIIAESPKYHRINIAACAVKWGKTLGCCKWLFQEAIENDGFKCVWGAPTYRQSLIAFDHIRKFIPAQFLGSQFSINKTIMRIEFLFNGSFIDFFSLDKPYNIEGNAYHRFVLDEAAKMRQEGFASVMTTLTQTKGRGWIISTPLGKNWFYREYLKGRSNAADYASYNFKTEDNPFVPRETIEHARLNLPADAFRQYYEAEFMDNNAGVFAGLMDCVGGEFETPRKGIDYIGGLDLAKHQDFTVFSVWNKSTRHLVKYYRFNKLNWPLQKREIIDIAKTWNDCQICIDRTGVGDAIYDDLAPRLNLTPFHFTNHSKADLIQKYKLAIEKGMISFPNDPIWLGEHEIYEYQISPSGNMTYNAPDGWHDDCVIAGALACLLLDLDNSRLTLEDLESLYNSTMSEDDSDEGVLKTIWGEEISKTNDW